MKLTAVLAALLAAGIVALGGRLLRERWSADGQYRLAERLYQAGDYEKAELGCQRALEWNPSHAPAKALYMEILFILGRGPSTPSTDYGSYTICNLGVSDVRHQQILVEIDTAFARAERDMEAGNPAQAEREWRKILEYAKWMPTGVEVASRAERAKGRLESLEARRCDR